MAHKDINDILYNLLTGQLTEDDQQQLDAWLDESPENKQQFDELMNADDFAASYHLYHSIDKNAAWQKFRERIDHTQGSANELGTPKGEQSAGHSSPLTFKNLLRVAAALLLLVVGAYWSGVRHATTPPTLSEEVLTAMAQSEENGKNEAVAPMPVLPSLNSPQPPRSNRCPSTRPQQSTPVLKRRPHWSPTTTRSSG